ncbi:MAG: nuclear transport factor 2 family protein [Roseobacter sp.]
MKDISKLAAGFYEIVNGEGELGDVLSDDFQFGIMPGFPFGGVQDGLDACKAFFEKLGPLFDNFEVHAEEFIPIDDENLVVKGFYRAKAAATGKEVDLETVHFWVSNGVKLTHYKHYCDTGLLSEALGYFGQK